MIIYNNTSSLANILDKISNLSKTDMHQLENALIERTITNVSSKEVYNITDYAFMNCSSLASVNFPACTTIGGSAFSGCPNLTQVSFPACTTIGSYAFISCYGLTSVSFPTCETIYPHAFQSCYALTSISLPACKTIGDYAFSNCQALTSISLPACIIIGNSAFYACSSLASIYLGASSVCTLISSVAFIGTGIRSERGAIFVPSSLITSYKQATNWTYFSSRIFAKE